MAIPGDPRASATPGLVIHGILRPPFILLRVSWQIDETLHSGFLLSVCCLKYPEPAMSDEEHHFESKADAGASKTFPQQAGTIRKNGYIVIKGRPCKVVEVSTSKTGKHGHAKCHFVAIDIFTAKKLEDIVPSSHNCDVPHVNRTDYQLIDISEDGFLILISMKTYQISLLTDSGNTKDDLRLPSDESLLSQIKDGFAEGKDLIVTVMSSMGEEQICALKDIGPK
ncbi:Eukaryotic translation initiation factor 5A-4 [Cucurbita argyrosperma subsp. argyrosperma]|nr:Eukaryotic translation initiation factor 5A-4 [Cucurbita argyrosperma subsp. argyrosperma]